MSIYKYSAATLAGEETSLETWRGRVLLIVNTASACGFTPQYAGLQALYQKYEPRGLTSWAFPATSLARRSRAMKPPSANSVKRIMASRFPCSPRWR